jgi:hypothetical protein
MHLANLSGADIRGTDLISTDLGRANLTNVNFYMSDLNDTDLREANLSGANLKNTEIFGADFTDAILEGANFSGAKAGRTIFGKNDLSKVKGLEGIEHYGPSIIGIDTLYLSQGQIPETFLRGCGVPDDFITYVRSLVTLPIQFYSCFISYSSKDQDFSERLYADLQSKGVRCWFAPEDLKIGDRFRDRIDESIHLHDKLLLILSENSVSSPWVSDEVEAAIERERREGRTVLFPIKIDEAVMGSEQAWAAAIRRTRHIGDFTRWKDHDSYQKAFERLLRDLKAEEKKA